MEYTVLVIGTHHPVGDEMLWSYELDKFNYFFRGSFEELEKEDLLKFHTVIVLEDVDKLKYIKIKEKFTERIIFVQHYSKRFFKKSDLVIAYDLLFSNYGNNILNEFFNKIEKNESIIINDYKEYYPISSQELEKCVYKVLNSEISKGNYFVSANQPCTVSHFYHVTLVYAGLRYTLIQNEADIEPVVLRDNTLFEKTFEYNFEIFEKSVLNLLRNRKYMPIVLGDFYNLYDKVYMVRSYNVNSNIVTMSSVDEMEKFIDFEKTELLSVNRV